MTVPEIAVSASAVMLRQLFYDIWFNNEALPPLQCASSPYALYALLSFMIFRINSIENASVSDLVKVNSLYKDVATRIITMLRQHVLSPTSINDLHEFLANERFFVVFIRELAKRYNDEDYLNYFLALSEVKKYYNITFKLFK